MIALFIATALADDGAPPEARRSVQPEAPSEGGLDFFALFQTRTTASDLASTNPLLDGQVVGQLGGTNGVTVDPEALALYSEQRAGAFLTYAPPVLSGDAALTAAFEVDWAFGDRSYGVGGNTGGGFGGDQVNLQTRRLHADFFPTLGSGHDVHVVVGLQWVGDGVNDPTASAPDELLRSGGRLMVLGSEAAGITLYGRLHDAWGDRVRWRLGTYTLLEQGLAVADDTWLSVADVQVHPAYATFVGAHLWYLQDRSGGTGGALGSGPTSALWQLQGGPAIDPYDGQVPPEGAPVDADVVWVGADAGFNAALDRGPAGVHGAALLNAGRVYAPVVHDDDILGGLADVEGRVRIAPGAGSVARIEGLLTSGAGADPQRYGGVVTANAWGVAGAIHATHGTMLLFPDPRAINRMVAVVSDVSAAGLGLRALSASIGYDPVPDRLTTTLGGAVATTADGTPWGSELNAHVVGEPLLLADVGLHGAVVLPGAASGLEAVPWTVVASLDWLVF